MRVSMYRLGLAILVTAQAACAASNVNANASRFDRDVGLATGPQGYEKAMKVLRQYRFEIERESLPPNLYIETRWRDRAPFDDERVLGIGSAQIRAIVRATQRAETGQGTLYSITIRLETRVQPSGSLNWTETAATPQYREYAQRIMDDLKRELEVGVRVFD